MISQQGKYDKRFKIIRKEVSFAFPLINHLLSSSSIIFALFLLIFHVIDYAAHL